MINKLIDYICTERNTSGRSALFTNGYLMKSKVDWMWSTTFHLRF